MPQALSRQKAAQESWLVCGGTIKGQSLVVLLGHIQTQQLAEGLRWKMKGEQPVFCKYHCTGDTGRVMGQCHCLSLATSNRCPQPSYGCLWHNQHRPKGWCMGWGFPSVAGEHGKDSPGIELYQEPQQSDSPSGLSLSLTSRCRPGGKVQWSADSSAPTRSLRSI